MTTPKPAKAAKPVAKKAPAKKAAAPKAARATPAPPAPQRVAAFFDFDGTIIDGYSALALLKDRAMHGQMGPQEALRLTLTGVGVAMGRAEVEDFMRVGAQAFAGKTAAELDKMGTKLAKGVLGGVIYPEALALITEHQRLGHTVVIASSALPFQVEPLARELGIDHVLCTRLGEQDGLSTGVVEGEMVWGKGKAAAVERFAAQFDISLEQSFGYANGDEDIDFLSVVGFPNAVQPGKELEAHADREGWPVVRFAERPKGSFLDMPRTLAAYGGLAVASVVGAGLGLLNRSRRVAANTSLTAGSEAALALAGVKVNVIGEDNAWVQRPAVFIFNHQSLLDPLVVFRIVQRDATPVGKKEVEKTPGLAQFAWLINAALIDRTNVAQAKDVMAPAVERLKEGYSIVIAPEGTRSVTPRIGPFKKGPFHMAIQGGVPIVPIILRNTGELMWRGSNSIRAGEVDALVLPPIPIEGWSKDNLAQKVAEVRQLYVDALDDWDAAVERVMFASLER